MGARVTTSTGSYTDPVATREWADSFADRTLQSNIAEKSLEYGIATRAELETIADFLGCLGPTSERVLLLLTHRSGGMEALEEISICCERYAQHALRAVA